MKKIMLICCLLSLLTLNTHSNTVSGIAINVHIAENISLSQESKNYLSDKVSQLLSENNVLGKNYSDRFYLLVNANVVEKNIVGGLPQRISQKIEMTYKIGDAIDNIIYSTYSQTYIGIGTTEIKSQINAFSKVKSNTLYSHFLEDAKKRIIEFYSQQCESIIQETEIYTQNKEYDKAIYKLSLIPHGVDCYSEALNQMRIVYSDKIEYENQRLLDKAQLAWNSKPNKEGAQIAIGYLEQMKTDKSNQKEIKKLLSSMNAKLQSDEEKEWEFMLEQYEQEQVLKQQKKQNDTDILNTCIQIGYDFLSKNLQPINIIKNILLW